MARWRTKRSLTARHFFSCVIHRWELVHHEGHEEHEGKSKNFESFVAFVCFVVKQVCAA
jgi:hypothetical protein